MADKNYFITGLTAQKLSKLIKNEITFCNLDIGTEKGIAVDEENMSPLLQVLGVKIISEEKTDMEGIVKVKLGKGEKAAEINVPEIEKEYKVSIDEERGGWDGTEAFLDILKEVLLPVVKKDILICSLGGRKRIPVRDDKFHVFCWSSSSEGITSTPPETMWGHGVSCRTESPTFTGQGIPITTEEGWNVAELVGDNLYIFHHISHYGKEEENAIFRRICQEVAAELTLDPAEKQKRKAEIQKREEELSRKAYIELCEKRLKKTIADTKESIKNGEKEIPELQGELVNLIREVNDCRVKLEQILSRQTLETEKFSKEFDSLIKIPGIEKVKVTEDMVFLFTEYIYLPLEVEGIKKILDIGKLKVEISLEIPRDERVYKCIRIFNLTRKGSGSDYNIHHPHVNRDGYPCFGNIEEMIPELIGNYEISALAQLLLQFLKSAELERHNDPTMFWPTRVIPKREQKAKKRKEVSK